MSQDRSNVSRAPDHNDDMTEERILKAAVTREDDALEVGINNRP